MQTNTQFRIKIDIKFQFKTIMQAKPSHSKINPWLFQVRSETLETIKAASLLAPETLYSFVEEWLKNQVKKAANLSQQDKQLCNLFSPFYLEWEALSQVHIFCRLLIIYSFFFFFLTSTSLVMKNQLELVLKKDDV